MCQTTTDNMHPFEKAGLGKAPFRFVGHERKVGPVMMADGITQVGSPGQPMGSCDYCHQGIADCYSVKSADGKTFVVGCDCIDKLYRDTNKTSSQLARDPVYQAFKREKNKVATQARHAREARKLAEYKAWVEENKAVLAEIKVLKGYSKTETQTLLEAIEWYLNHAGMKGNLDMYKRAQKLVAERQAAS